MILRQWKIWRDGAYIGKHTFGSLRYRLRLHHSFAWEVPDGGAKTVDGRLYVWFMTDPLDLSSKDPLP